MYTIIEIIEDLAHKYRARVIINNETLETRFFKFDHYPSQDEVDSAVNEYFKIVYGV